MARGVGADGDGFHKIGNCDLGGWGVDSEVDGGGRSAIGG